MKKKYIVFISSDGKEAWKDKLRLEWRFYLRLIKQWLVPCDKCQEKLEEQWNIGYFIDSEWYERYISRASNLLCDKCVKKVKEINDTSEVVLGNTKYEPPVELSRSWVPIEGYKHKITPEEYRLIKKQKDDDVIYDN